MDESISPPLLSFNTQRKKNTVHMEEGDWRYINHIFWIVKLQLLLYYVHNIIDHLYSMEDSTSTDTVSANQMIYRNFDHTTIQNH